MRFLTVAVAALALSGCATTYKVSLMPRDSGKLYTGTAQEAPNGDGRISITIEGKTYNGTWVQTTPDHTAAFALGYGRRGTGRIWMMDNPQGVEAKALLSASDGSGLRCDLRSSHGTGGGLCRDDRGKEYDVQLRPAPRG